MHREKNRVSQFGPVVRFRSAIVPGVAQRFLCLGPVYDGNKTNIVPFCVRVLACLTQLRALRKPFSTLQLLCFLAIKSFRRPQFRVSRFFLSPSLFLSLFFPLSSLSLSLSLSIYISLYAFVSLFLCFVSLSVFFSASIYIFFYIFSLSLSFSMSLIFSVVVVCLRMLGRTLSRFARIKQL